MRCVFFSSPCWRLNVRLAGSDSCSAWKMASSTQPNIWVKSFRVPRQALRYCPLQPCASPAPHLHSPPVRLLLMENLTNNVTPPPLPPPPPAPLTAGMKLAASPPPLLHYWGRQGSPWRISAIPFVPLRSTSSTSRHHMCPLWNGNLSPLKKRQPGADCGRSYANVDTAKYHTRRGGKKSLRGKQIG